MMYGDLFKRLSEKLPALDKMPVEWIPKFYFIHATAESCYGWHIEIRLVITSAVSYCIKCGYDGSRGQIEESLAEEYCTKKGLPLSSARFHRHSWRIKDVPLYSRYIHFDNELDAVNEEIASLIKEKGEIL